MDVLAFLTLTVTGFVGCAEFGSYAFVHPVLRRLPQRERVEVEQGLLKTFGRIMPIGMTASVVLAILLATSAATPAWSSTAPTALVVSLITTIAVNVPINRATGRWDTEHPPAGWGTHPPPLGNLPGHPLLATPHRLRHHLRRRDHLILQPGRTCTTITEDGAEP